ncbi:MULTISPECIES: DNA adenine methylase [Buttiauxella]|jgi:DNA adenine methylase|uniref:DNA adenine methylase n=1 Tax=Enterobacterales TaxID=91347 RepID=UPI001065B2F8|nr:Dam family site-specific DNA-(adenine-N6)-methyltransferase [Buttiauxella sp. BIGb0552]TDX12095.1 DNA adenine methylase [Buttiauxella sp. BIGb0552]
MNYPEGTPLPLHQPMLKWAGGKTKLMPFIRRVFPMDPARRWVEPFTGSGAVFLNVFANHALLSDSNDDLINFYKTIQTKKQEFIAQITALSESTFDKPGYYRLVEEFQTTEDKIRKSVLFYAINRLCFNGLCRYNKNKKFNVPWNKKDHLEPNFPRLDYLSFRLSGVELISADFEQTLVAATGHDQIYCDPPYIKLKKDSFTKYDGKEFSEASHTRLADLLVAAHAKGARVAISNSDTEFAVNLYEERNFKIHRLSAYRSVGASSGSRQAVSEILAVLE